ncbi:hypothetical protein AGABI1DRAFT_95310 [Agaricus bisporus var. burnettii JB137-S8]|uniref:Uncharacterized protein n=1 Tax=Agaricus bisporus var. burnettii (strain JB137-S8 / ATCC MYA-4627 / FGSC 10392) TaxID=597362 RepID=K5WHW8_AGABU|nr:uncharacterized protein AGABI1DRAFT_95310 [Agaricus bisporus var. burnettii JB137-S8]EKM74876.1 hypothetical protein AGABI1DRAFT_95310 [Agaricus bisporus var. burnettii JB137-S8]
MPLPRKREDSFDAQSRLPPAKVAKHHRSNSGSVSKDKQDKAAGLLQNLIQYCVELEKLLEVESHNDGPTADSTKETPGSDWRSSPSNIDTLSRGFVDKIRSAMTNGTDFEDWLVNGFREQQPSSSEQLQTIGEEGEDAQEESNRLSFSYLKKVAVALQENLALLKAMREGESEDYNVEIIPFSSVIESDYDKLAIQNVYNEVDVEHLWKQILHDTSVRLDTAERYVNAWSEMTARKDIDAYIDSVGDEQIFPNHKHPIVTSPEFGILGHAQASFTHCFFQKKEPNAHPVINKGKKLKTYLSGSTDYLTILVSAKDLKRDMIRGRKQWKSKSGQKAWLERVMQAAQEDNTIRLSICEAKWPGAKLEKHIPQVVAEAIGLRWLKTSIISTSQLNTRRKYVPFCLSNGVEWIFGALEACGDTFAALNRFWVTKPYRVNGIHEAFKILSILRFWQFYIPIIKAMSDESAIWKLGCPEDWPSAADILAQAMQEMRVESSSKSPPSGKEKEQNIETKPEGRARRRAGGK